MYRSFSLSIYISISVCVCIYTAIQRAWWWWWWRITVADGGVHTFGGGEVQGRSGGGGDHQRVGEACFRN
ncbi:hypothetical protein Ccrd_021664 [Cynara cardunculus var. scolymus]|uniref:Uncharacterized protein n=1 Tax=Cynara cardunculus var. scolymus TaxID=59895 RepID=A0A103Y054_CYNCS|nr:hypothetical protein Ccrd_021664 [Cynara cardunculus var. scolymus]